MINVYDAGKYAAVIKRAVEFSLKKFDLKGSDVELEIELIDEEEMRELNNEARSVDAVTDVLSFPNLEVKLPFNIEDYEDDVDPENGAVILGEISICKKRAAEQAEEYGHSLSRELAFLTTHGMLHLFGYDHMEEEEREEMEVAQTEILEAAGLTREVTDDEFCAEVDDSEEETETENDDSEEEAQENEDDDETDVLVGSIAILGRPNAGKSTLVNAIVGEKVSIVSWKPQTTRNRILGIYNDAEAQIMIEDTPGLHAPRNALGKFMMRSVTTALEGVDIVVYVMDAEKVDFSADLENISRYIEAGKKTLVVVNKNDRVAPTKIAEILTMLNENKEIASVVPLSALRNRNVDALIGEIKKLLPVGKRIYDKELYTDRDMRFMASEIIREKAMRLLDKEVPYGIGIVINKYEYRKNGILDIDADVIIQKQQHKPIVLGKNGETIKKIATYARQDLETMTGDKIFLTLWVRVKPEWRDDIKTLVDLGYDKDNV